MIQNKKNFDLIMVAAQMESGGNVFHRHLDGHPNIFCFPFESQTGNRYSQNIMIPYFYPIRYGWPQFREGTTFEQAWSEIWNEEVKCYLRVRERSKFRNCGMVMDEKKLFAAYLDYCKGKLFSRRNVVKAFFYAHMIAWENYNFTGEVFHICGYNPGMLGDTDLFFKDFPEAHIIYVIRNVASAYGDYLNRPYPQQSLEEYSQTYAVGHAMAYNYSIKYPNNFHLLKFENFIKDKKTTLFPILTKIGIDWNDSFLYPSFNGKDLSEKIAPWGTLEKCTPEYNKSMAMRHSQKTLNRLYNECALTIEKFNYKEFFIK